jgi:hypothetical protein
VVENDEPVGDNEGAVEKLLDRVGPGHVLGVVDLVEDVVEQAVGAVLQGVEQSQVIAERRRQPTRGSAA